MAGRSPPKIKAISDYHFPEIVLSEEEHMQASALSFLSGELRLKYTVLTKTENPNQIDNEIFQTLPILRKSSTNIETSKAILSEVQGRYKQE